MYGIILHSSTRTIYDLDASELSDHLIITVNQLTAKTTYKINNCFNVQF